MVQFKTDLNQLQATTVRARSTVDAMLTNAKELQAAVDFVNRWQGEAANAFRGTMGVNTGQLTTLVNQLEKMAQSLQQTTDGVATHDTEGAKKMTATQGQGALSGAPLNR